MRIERWFWLPIFCVVSMLLHAGVAYVARGAVTSVRAPDSPSIEIAFDPVVIPPPTPKPVQALPEPKPKPRPTLSVAPGPRPRRVAPFRVHTTPRIRIARSETLVPTEVPGTAAAPVAKPTPAPVDLPDRVKAETPETTPHKSTALNTPPAFHRISRDPTLTEGGGSPSPAPVPGGHDGLKAPEAPKEDVVYSGGGRGGANLPPVAAVTGGGGGASILSVKGSNPLNAEVAEELPGGGPGTGGGRGTGSQGGVGFAAGRGIGTSPNGKLALGSLRRSVGPGIGAATSGSGTGTRAPGGGRGRGADLPGTGGAGAGYGRGKGVRIGDGTDESGPPKQRGVPFGDVASLLGSGSGGPGAGKGIALSGAPGRGAVFGTRQAGGGDGPLHIVYALDISGSMRDGFKIVKARDALKKALGELRPSDTFNIIVFKSDAYTFQDDSVPATIANVANARIFVDSARMGNGTNISAAFDLAFGMNGINQIYLMTDGEPNGGIQDFAELRRFVRFRNTKNIKIATLALGMGENFPGIFLLKGIAEDNHGSFEYIDMTKIPRPAFRSQ